MGNIAQNKKKTKHYLLNYILKTIVLKFKYYILRQFPRKHLPFQIFENLAGRPSKQYFIFKIDRNIWEGAQYGSQA